MKSDHNRYRRKRKRHTYRKQKSGWTHRLAQLRDGLYGLLENGYASLPVATFLHLLVLLLFIPGKKEQPTPGAPKKSLKMILKKPQLKKQKKTHENIREMKTRVGRKQQDPSQKTSGSDEKQVIKTTPGRNQEKKTTQQKGTLSVPDPDPNHSSEKPKPSSRKKDRKKNSRKSDLSIGEQKKKDGEQLSRWERHLKNMEKKLKNQKEKFPVSSGEEGTAPGGKGQRRATYYQQFSLYLGKFFTMPKFVRFNRINDTVVLQILIKKDGTLTIDKPIRLSTYPRLNQVARHTIRKAKSFKKPPRGKDGGRSMTVRVTFHFRAGTESGD